MHPCVGGEPSLAFLQHPSGGHEDTGCHVSHDLQEGEPIGRVLGGGVYLLSVT